MNKEIVRSMAQTVSEEGLEWERAIEKERKAKAELFKDIVAAAAVALINISSVIISEESIEGGRQQTQYFIKHRGLLLHAGIKRIPVQGTDQTFTWGGHSWFLLSTGEIAQVKYTGDWTPHVSRYTASLQHAPVEALIKDVRDIDPMIETIWHALVAQAEGRKSEMIERVLDSAARIDAIITLLRGR